MRKRLFLLLTTSLGILISVPQVHAFKRQLVTIQTHHTGSGGKLRYIRAQSNGNMGNDRVKVTSEEKFTMITHDDGKVSFKSGFGKLVTTSSSDDLRATATSVSSYAKFTMIRHTGGKYSFKTRRGKYWSARKYYMIANRTSVGAWEKFRVNILRTLPNAPPPVSAKEKLVSLRSVHGKNVRAQANGNMGNDSRSDGPEERFWMITHADGKVSFRSYISNKYVSAKSNGDLRADIVRVGPQEKFTVTRYPGGTYAFKSKFNRYWVAEKNGAMRANRTRAVQWETFWMKVHPPANITKAQLHAAIKRYAPVLQMAAGERYRLSTPEHFIRNSTVYRYKGRLSLRLKSKRARMGDWRNARAYVRAKIGKVSTDIQYWFFYNYNGPGTIHLKRLKDFRMKHLLTRTISPCGVHEGDWEHVTVRISNKTRKITGLYLSQHDGGKWVMVGTKLGKKLLGSRIRIFSSKNGHGSYLQRGRNYSKVKKWGVAEFRLINRTSRGRRLDARKRYRIISVSKYGKKADRAYGARPPSWLKYTGRWGRVKKNTEAYAMNRLTKLLITVLTFGQKDLKEILEDIGIWGECMKEAGSSAPWSKCNWRASETSDCQFYSTSMRVRSTKLTRWAESKWKRCNKCQSLHYSPLTRRSRCPAGGKHTSSGKQSFTLMKSVPTLKIRGAQTNWRYCRKCQGISYAPFARNSRCPAGGKHLTKSENYQLYHAKKPTRTPLPTQAGWRWCKKCQLLHYGPMTQRSRCPRGGKHSIQQSGEYYLYVHGKASTPVPPPPRSSSGAKCWIRLPSGCNNRAAERVVKGITSRGWVHDRNGANKGFCEGPKFRRNVNAFCKKSDAQTFWGTRSSSGAKCWIRLPSGCNNRAAERVVKGITSRGWVHDRNGANKSFCEGPKFRRNVNTFCKKSDAQTFWGNR